MSLLACADKGQHVDEPRVPTNAGARDAHAGSVIHAGMGGARRWHGGSILSHVTQVVHLLRTLGFYVEITRSSTFYKVVDVARTWAASLP